MAYVGSSKQLCEAIVNSDVGYVRSWCQQAGVDVNVRDFCGRTPLHLACLNRSTDLSVVQCLIDHGARLVARLQDGRTALHIAAAVGRQDIVRALLKKSAENEHLFRERKRAIKPARGEGEGKGEESHNMESDEGSDDFNEINASDANSTTCSDGFVKVQPKHELEHENALDGDQEVDVYDVDITDWE